MQPDSIDDGHEPRPKDEPGLSPLDLGTIGAGIEASQIPLAPDSGRDLRKITLHFRDEAERDRFFAFYPRAELSEFWFAAGIKNVEDVFLPRLMRGEYGITREDIYRAADAPYRAGLHSLRRDKVDRKLIWCFTQAWKGRFAGAVDAFLENVRAIEEATEALGLIAAGFSKATAAMERAARAGSPAAAPLPGLGAPLAQLRPHALALGREPAPAASSLPAFLAGHRIGDGARRPLPARPLRPGDLGALPALGRP